MAGNNYPAYWICLAALWVIKGCVMKKSWGEKLATAKPYEIKHLAAGFADLPAGCQMLIPSPPIIDGYLRAIPHGKAVDIAQMRDDLARQFGADKSCPLTTGIFLRIVCEAAFELIEAGADTKDVTPFWRVVTPKMPLAAKLACGKDFLVTKRAEEGVAA